MRDLIERLRRFGRQADGNLTIEYVLWLPVMAGLILLTTDATMLMHVQTTMTAAARDTARQVALGRATAAEAQAALLTRLGAGKGYVADVEVEDRFVTATIRLPFDRVLALGGVFPPGMLASRAVMYIEAESDAG